MPGASEKVGEGERVGESVVMASAKVVTEHASAKNTFDKEYIVSCSDERKSVCFEKSKLVGSRNVLKREVQVQSGTDLLTVLRL